MMMEKRLRKTDSLDVSKCGWKLHGDSEARLDDRRLGIHHLGDSWCDDLLAESGRVSAFSR